MIPEEQEWAPISVAARRLGLSDRHARRLTLKLDPSDKIKEAGAPLRVRVSAMSGLWEREGKESGITPDEVSESAIASAPPSESSAEEAVSRARLEEKLLAAEVLIQELRSDKAHLSAALEREQENQRRLLDQLADERRDLRLLSARHALPLSSTDESDMPITVAVSSAAPAPASNPMADTEGEESDFGTHMSDSPIEPPLPPLPPISTPIPPQPAPNPPFMRRMLAWFRD